MIMWTNPKPEAEMLARVDELTTFIHSEEKWQTSQFGFSHYNLSWPSSESNTKQTHTDRHRVKCEWNFSVSLYVFYLQRHLANYGKQDDSCAWYWNEDIILLWRTQGHGYTEHT